MKAKDKAVPNEDKPDLRPDCHIRQAGPEIEITPVMVEAGVMELAGFDWMECDEEDAVRRVFLAMSLAARIPEKAK